MRIIVQVKVDNRFVQILFLIWLDIRPIFDHSYFPLISELSQPVDATNSSSIISTQHQHLPMVLHISLTHIGSDRCWHNRWVYQTNFPLLLLSHKDGQVVHGRSMFYTSRFYIEYTSMMRTIHLIVEQDCILE